MIMDMLTPDEIRELARSLAPEEVIRAMGKYASALSDALPHFTAMLNEKPSFLAGIAVGLALADAGVTRKVLMPPILGRELQIE